MKGINGAGVGQSGEVTAVACARWGRARELWGQTRHHVFFTGHLHHEHVRDVGGVTVFQLRSLASPDRWHKQQGYIHGPAGMDAYLTDRDGGPCGSLWSLV